MGAKLLKIWCGEELARTHELSIPHRAKYKLRNAAFALITVKRIIIINAEAEHRFQTI